jgi:hypothetical protein
MACRAAAASADRLLSVDFDASAVPAPDAGFRCSRLLKNVVKTVSPPGLLFTS